MISFNEDWFIGKRKKSLKRKNEENIRLFVWGFNYILFLFSYFYWSYCDIEVGVTVQELVKSQHKTCERPGSLWWHLLCIVTDNYTSTMTDHTPPPTTLVQRLPLAHLLSTLGNIYCTMTKILHSYCSKWIKFLKNFCSESPEIIVFPYSI